MCLRVCLPLLWDSVSATDKSPPHAARQHRDMGSWGCEGDQSREGCRERDVEVKERTMERERDRTGLRFSFTP